MNTEEVSQNPKRTIRNLVIFSIATVFGGWVGLWIDGQMGMTGGQTLGALIWLITPLATGLLLRMFGGDGWKTAGFRFNLRGNGRWYLASLLIYPLSIGLVLLVGWVLGVITFPKAGSGALGAFIQVVLMGFATNFVKNIFEEFSWRGYFSPQIQSLRIHPFLGYFIVGVMWVSWHLPYWYGFLDASTLESYSPYSNSMLVVMSIPALFAASIVYGELQQLTKSTWPAFLIHTVGNAFILAVLLEGYIKVNHLPAVFTPGMEGVLMMLIFFGLGIWLYRVRVSKEQ